MATEEQAPVFRRIFTMEFWRAQDGYAIAMRVSVITLLINILLSLIKLGVGIFANSDALISDAIHSASDAFSTIIVMIGVTIAKQKADRKHPYGHERMEYVASLTLAIVLMITGLSIGYEGVERIVNSSKIVVPGKLALAAAVLSIVVKEWMFWYTRHYAKQVNSGALMADAWHHRSDAISSIGALIGIWGSLCGYAIMDDIACVVICCFVMAAGVKIFRDATNKLADASCSEDFEKRITTTIMAQPGVKHLDVLRSRQFGARVYLEVEIAADGNLPLREAHKIAEGVHHTLEAEYPEIKHCTVHVNPLIDCVE